MIMMYILHYLGYNYNLLVCYPMHYMLQTDLDGYSGRVRFNDVNERDSIRLNVLSLTEDHLKQVTRPNQADETKA